MFNSSKNMFEDEEKQLVISKLSYDYSFSTDIGERSSQEDRYICEINNDKEKKEVSFFAVYDGHGDSTVSVLLSENHHKIFAPKELHTFLSKKEKDKQFKDKFSNDDDIKKYFLEYDELIKKEHFQKYYHSEKCAGSTCTLSIIKNE